MKFNTYIINLDTHIPRYEAQVKQLNAVGINPIRIRAFTYDDIPEEEVAKHFAESAPRWTPKSIVACGYSHKMAIKTFLDQDEYPVALILEDDAFPLFDDVRFLEEKLNHTNWDILSLHCDGSCEKKSRFYNPGSAAAYFITKEGAKKVLGHKYKDHFDLETNHLPFITKTVDTENSFWTDEDAVLSKTDSANRSKSKCSNWLRNLTPIFFSRGEKTLCHSKNYYVFKIPYIERNVTVEQIIGTLFFLILAILLYLSIS